MAIHADALWSVLSSKFPNLVIAPGKLDIVGLYIKWHTRVHDAPLLAIASHVLAPNTTLDAGGETWHPTPIVPAIASLPLFLALKSLLHLPALVVDGCESLHLVVRQPIHGYMLALDVGICRHIHLVFTLGLLSHELLLPTVLFAWL